MANTWPYRTARWKKLRAEILGEHPQCFKCMRPAKVVDHIHPIKQGGSPWGRSNLQPLCHPCHNQKTRISQGDTGVLAKAKARTGCTPDGMPRDGWWAQEKEQSEHKLDDREEVPLRQLGITPTYVDTPQNSFHHAIRVDENGCWIWQWEGMYFTYEGRPRRARHVAWFFEHGVWPSKPLFANCGNWLCVNPNHATEGQYTHCRRGHELSGDNIYLHANGERQCRKCMNAASLRSYRNSNKKPDQRKKVCKNGHPRPENPKLNRAGAWQCEECAEARKASAYYTREDLDEEGRLRPEWHARNVPT